MLAGRYRLTEPLGAGRIGTVWLAHDRKLDQDVAIKIPHPWQGRNPEFVARFRRELLTGMRLHHPAVVRSLDTGQHEGLPYLVMELVQGAPIHLWFEAHARRDFEALSEVLEEVLDALSYAHGRRLIHQDLKPDNIMVDEGAQVHITDFGLAGRLEDQTRTDDTGVMMADLAYLSPEQAMGERGGVRSDLYSLGAVLYHVLTGRPPVEARDPAQFLLAILNQSPQSPHRLRGDIPAWLTRLTMRLMARQPEDRPASAAEVARLVQRQASRQSDPMPAGKRRNLLGRDEELTQLRGHLQELKAGRGTVVRVTGTAGSGKTSLVEEFLRRARPVAHCKVQCSAMQPLHCGLLERALGGQGTLSERLRQRLAQGPLILVVEWAHEATPELVERLRALLADGPAVLLILIDRPGKARFEGTTQWLNEAQHRLVVRGLTRDFCARYVEEHLWAAPPDAAVSWLMRMTHGNPLHLGLLLRQLEGSALQLSGVVATWEEPRDVPRTLTDLLNWVLERQGPDASAIMSMAASLEERFELGLLQSVVTYEERVLEDTLDGLVRAGLLDEQWEGGVQQFLFAHEPIWRVALHRIPERRQRRLCLLAGNLTAGVDPERAARFFARALNAPRAVEQLLLAAERDFEAGLPECAAFLSGQAERLASEDGHLAGELVRAVLLKARALAAGGHNQAAREAAHRTLKLGPSAEQADQARTLLRRTPIEPGKRPAAVAPAGKARSRQAPPELAPELALSPAAKRAVLGARKKGVAPPAPRVAPTRAGKTPAPALTPPASVPRRAEKPAAPQPAAASPGQTVRPAGQAAQPTRAPASLPESVKAPARPFAAPWGGTTSAPAGPVEPGFEAPAVLPARPAAPASGSSENVAPVAPRSVKPPSPVPPARVRPQLPPVVHPAQRAEPEELLAPGRLAGPMAAGVQAPHLLPPVPATAPPPSVPPEPPRSEPPPPPSPERAQPQVTQVSQEPPAPPPEQIPEFVEPPEMAARRRYETARAAGDRLSAARAAEELARHFEAARDRQKASLWRHQARLLSAAP